MAESAAKKPGVVERVKRFFRDAKGECKKVVWPSKKQVRINTITVLVVVLIAAVVLVVLDLVFGGVIHLLIGG